MNQRLSTSLMRCTLFILPFLFLACVNKTTPDFPYDKKYSVKPTTKSFEFSKLDTIQWETKTTSKYNDLPSKKFRWDQLPSKRVEIGFPYEGSPEKPEKPFYFDSLPAISFSYDSIPKEELKVRVINLGEPVIEEAGPLTVPVRGTRGLKSVEEGFGLPNAVTSANLNSDGSIWFGTKGGYIARYDSNELLIYGQDQGIEFNSDILTIKEGPNGLLWVASSDDRILVIDLKARLIYELISSTLYHRIFEINFAKDGTAWFRNTGRDPGLLILDFKEKTLQKFVGEPFQGFIIMALEDHEGLIWASTSGGVNIIDREKNKIMTLDSQHGLDSDVVSNIFQDDQNRMWISTNTGLNIISADKKSIQSIGSNEGLSGINEAWGVYKSKSDKYWIGTRNGLMFSYDEKKNIFEKYDTSDSSALIWDIFEDFQNQIWGVDAFGGAYVIDQKSGQPANIDGSDGLDFNKVWTTLVDEKGRIWLGTEDGLAVYDRKTKIVKFITENEGLISNYIYNLMLDSKGRIWVLGSGRGLSVVDPEKGEIKQLRSENELNNNRVTEAVEDRNQMVWIGGFGGELLQYDPSSDKLKVFRDSLSEDRITDLKVDKANNIYVGTQGQGIHIVDPQTNLRKTLTTQSALISDDNMSLEFDDQGDLWAAGLKGVERIDLSNQKISLFRKDQGLAANDIYAIAVKDGRIFMGNSRGITVLEPQSLEEDTWNAFTIGKDQGMIETDISQNSFSFDSDGYLWAGSNALMLNVVDPVVTDTMSYPVEISSFNLFDERQNFLDQEHRSMTLSEHDSVWIWSKNQYNLLNEKAKDSLVRSELVLDYSSIDSKSGLPADLKLKHDQNYISFNFNGGQYRNPESMAYSYILEGVDKNWSKISSEPRSENYRDLPPGDYTFKVAAKGFNNIWSKPKVFSFSILPPWWKTRWAYLFYILFVGSIVYAFIQYRSRWLKRENRLLEERVNQRTAQLKKTIDELETTQGQLIQSEKMASLGELTAGIAHEIQNPMNFINNFSEVSHELLDEMMEEIDKGDMEEAKEISNDIKQNLEKISHHGHRASSIVRGMLEHSRNSSGQKEDIDINVLADEYLRLAYHGLRAKDKSFNAKFETDFDDSIGKIEIIPQDIGRVMLNLINNAFYAVSDRDDKEADESYQPTVKVTTKKLKDQVKITVEDNGSGIPQEIKDKIFQPFFTTKPSGKGTGLGLSLTYDIITQGHSGALELDSEVGKGTVFTIFLPVKQ